MISKKLFPIIISIYFFQYAFESNLNYFNFQKFSKKNVLMHRPSIKKSLPQHSTVGSVLGPFLTSADHATKKTQVRNHHVVRNFLNLDPSFCTVIPQCVIGSDINLNTMILTNRNYLASLEIYFHCFFQRLKFFADKTFY